MYKLIITLNEKFQVGPNDSHHINLESHLNIMSIVIYERVI